MTATRLEVLNGLQQEVLCSVQQICNVKMGASRRKRPNVSASPEMSPRRPRCPRPWRLLSTGPGRGSCPAIALIPDADAQDVVAPALILWDTRLHFLNDSVLDRTSSVGFLRLPALRLLKHRNRVGVSRMAGSEWPGRDRPLRRTRHGGCRARGCLGDASGISVSARFAMSSASSLPFAARRLSTAFQAPSHSSRSSHERVEGVADQQHRFRLELVRRGADRLQGVRPCWDLEHLAFQV